ncbi:hypothetical protein SAMN04487899_1187 [Segatella bryantii]|jgi:hypothetical protein|nr:hypothetical protein SAMN04487899_1187 [Segatella bryantii]
MDTANFNWDASSFFEKLTNKNKFAIKNGFVFCRVSSLDGFEEALDHMQSRAAFVCVSDTSQGYINLDNSPHTRRVKTVFLAKRHSLKCMTTRQKCMDDLRELFRQFMSVLILESTKLQEHSIYLDPRISFQEIDEYFFSGCACAYFQIAVDTYTDLRYNKSEWL